MSTVAVTGPGEGGLMNSFVIVGVVNELDGVGWNLANKVWRSIDRKDDFDRESVTVGY